MIKLGKRTIFAEVKIGEVYAVDRENGVFDIEVRTHDNIATSMILCGDSWEENGIGAGHTTAPPCSDQKIYKLPESTQRLWKEE